MRLKLQLILLFVISPLISLSQTEKIPSSETTYDSFHPFGLRINASYGFTIAHRPALLPLQEHHIRAISVSYVHQTNGKRKWQSAYNFPQTSLTFDAFDLGNDQLLGYGFALYPAIAFPLGKSKNPFVFRYGMGIGYVTKPFDALTNFQNAAIGSSINAVVHFDLHYKHYINSKNALELGAGITHFSNGSFQLPNLGINIATASAGWTYFFDKSDRKFYNESESMSKSGWQLSLAGALKRIYPPGGKLYSAFTISSRKFYKATNRSDIGGGVDLFYDGSLSTRINVDQNEKSNATDNYRAGIFFAYQLNVGKLGLGFNMGGYLYNQFKNDGNFYHRICINYYLDKIYFMFNLKSHYARADFFETGIGFRL